jgi:hypothetical protein
MSTRNVTFRQKKNEKGEITTWNSDSEDGKLLKTLVESNLLDDKKPTEIRTSHPAFMKYSPNTFRSALTNARRSFNNELYRRNTRDGM